MWNKHICQFMRAYKLMNGCALNIFQKTRSVMISGFGFLPALTDKDDIKRICIKQKISSIATRIFFPRRNCNVTVDVPKMVPLMFNEQAKTG